MKVSNLFRQIKFLVRGSALVSAMSEDINILNQSFSRALHEIHFDHKKLVSDFEAFQRAATDHLRQIQPTLGELEAFQRAATDHLQQLQYMLNEIKVSLAHSEAELFEVRSEVAGYSETYKAHLLAIQDRLAYRASRDY